MTLAAIPPLDHSSRQRLRSLWRVSWCLQRSPRRCLSLVALGIATGLLPARVAAQAEADAAAGPAVPRATMFSAGIGIEASTLETRGRPTGGNGMEVSARISPSLAFASRGGRLQGSIAYGGALSTRRGIDDREDADFANTLSAAYVLEAIEGIGFVDARASVTQQAVYAAGVPQGAAGFDRNRAEVVTVSVSPYLRGALGGSGVEYELRGTGTGTKSEDASVGSSKAAQALFSLRSAGRGSVLGWGVTGLRNQVKYAAASSSTITDRLSAQLIFRPDVDWQLSVTAGKERTDVVGAVRREYENYGAGLQWTPSPRTTVSVEAEERYFGRSYRALIEHRLRRSTLRYIDVRDVTGGVDTLSAGAPVTLYSLLFAAFEQQIPDPAQRDQFVLALIQATGRSRDDLVSGGLFSSAGVAVQRRRDLVWTLVGPRLTLSLTGFTVSSERVDTGSVNPSGLNDNVAQTGYSGSVGWRLTPSTSLSASASRALSQDRVTLARSDLKAATVGLSTRLAPRATGTLSARYSVLNGVADPYRETALGASLSLLF